MKSILSHFKYTFLIILSFTSLLISCENKEEVKLPTPDDEVVGLQRIDTLVKGDYTFYIYKKDAGNLVVGYNEIYIQLKNNATGKFIEDANLSWQPLMHMTSMSHACPYSTISKVPDTKTLYKGYFIFIMASDDTEYWEITYNYTTGTDTLAQVANRPPVINTTGRIHYKSFIGSDNAFYFLALVNPINPRVGTNEISAYLYKKINKYTFVPVENYTIEIDPRMPDMDNHTSPNNVNLTYNPDSKLYKGKLNLTMTGYWKINLRVKDTSNTLLKGDSITSTTPGSSIYFELEF